MRIAQHFAKAIPFPRDLANVIAEFCFEKSRTSQLCEAEWAMVTQLVTILMIDAYEIQGCGPLNLYLPFQSNDYHPQTLLFFKQQFWGYVRRVKRIFRIANLHARTIDSHTIVNHSWCMHFLRQTADGALLVSGSRERNVNCSNPFPMLKILREYDAKKYLYWYGGSGHFLTRYPHIHASRVLQLIVFTWIVPAWNSFWQDPIIDETGVQHARARTYPDPRDVYLQNRNSGLSRKRSVALSCKPHASPMRAF